MSEKKLEKRGLGRGLSALMADVNMSHEAESDPRPSAQRNDGFRSKA